MPGTTRPSALLTTLLVTTTTSPSTGASAATTRAARSSPGRTSGTPSGATTVSGHDTRLDRGRGHRGRRVEVGHVQGYGGRGQAGRAQPVELVGVRLVDQPAVEDAAVRAGAVVAADAAGAHLDADRGEHLLGHPADVGAADDGGEADHRRLRGDQRLADPRDAEDGADRDHRVRRRQQHQVGVGDRVDDAGGRRRLVETDHHDRLGRHLGAQPHPVLLEVHHPASARRLGVGDRHVGLDPVVGHRQQPDARTGRASARTAPR